MGSEGKPTTKSTASAQPRPLKKLVSQRPKLTVWNIVDDSKSSRLSLPYVLNLYRKAGHTIQKQHCPCCYDCAKCQKSLLDDLRTEASFDKKCGER